MFKAAGALLLGFGLMMPIVAQDRDDHDRRERYYDRDHRDYHQWNEGENRAWHRYWEEQRHEAIEWQRATEAQRAAYWRWRHAHPDRDDRR